MRLTEQAQAALDRRLLSGHPRPIAVAVSGGGDSLALLLIARHWARAARRELIVLTVDHRLQAAGAAWSADCAAIATRLGCGFRSLAWEGDKPAHGLPAAARQARHRLLADAARQTGASVILLGHTADDILEARAMRAAGSTTPEPREWAPSPAWPEGRGVFLLRPLLGVRRAALRGWLQDQEETWMEDPANDDTTYARVRARRLMRDEQDPGERTEPPPLRIAEAVEDEAGVLTLSRHILRAAPPADAARLVAMAAVCAGGGSRRPAGARVLRAAAILTGDGPVVTTLAGARLEAEGEQIRVFREPGEAGRGGLAPGRGIWDGRFEIAEAAEVRRLAGLGSRLGPEDRRRVNALPPAARGALPVVVEPQGVRLAQARSLVGERLRAAAGLVERESAGQDVVDRAHDGLSVVRPQKVGMIAVGHVLDIAAP